MYQALWRRRHALGGVALAAPDSDPSAVTDWWRAYLPEAIATGSAPDPLWIDHANAALEHAADVENGGQQDFTVPISFSDAEGFAFRSCACRLSQSLANLCHAVLLIFECQPIPWLRTPCPCLIQYAYLADEV